MAPSGMLSRVALVRTLEQPHGVTSHKAPFFIVIAVKTSYLTYSSYVIIFLSANIIRQGKVLKLALK
jgi:hypothetical protein